MQINQIMQKPIRALRASVADVLTQNGCFLICIENICIYVYM